MAKIIPAIIPIAVVQPKITTTIMSAVETVLLTASGTPTSERVALLNEIVYVDGFN